MNWRNTSQHQDWYYDHPATQLFPRFEEWFAYLRHTERMRTYFNDHPYPVVPTVPMYLERGLRPAAPRERRRLVRPPHHADQVRAARLEAGHELRQRGRVAGAASLPGLVDGTELACRPPWSRWWTGACTGSSRLCILTAAVTVAFAACTFSPAASADLGGVSSVGDYRPKQGGDLLRWTAHCVFGSILRFHGNDHRPWTYTPAVEATIRSYLEMRYKLIYKLIPALIAGGAHATATGFPLAARCDLSCTGLSTRRRAPTCSTSGSTTPSSLPSTTRRTT